MNVYLFGILFLLLEIGIVAFLVINMIIKRKLIEKTDAFYIGPLFVLVWAMYICALFYYNIYVEPTSTSLISILSLAKTTLESFVFSFEIALIEPIMASSFIMSLAYTIMIILASLTTALTVLFILKNIVNNFLKKCKALKNNGDIVLGFSDDAKKYNKINPSSIIWDDKIDYNLYKDLISKNYVVFNEKLSAKRLYSRLKSGSHHLILFKDSNFSYSYILKLFEDVVAIKNTIANKRFKRRKARLLKKLNKQNPDLSQKDLEKLVNEKFEKAKKDNAIYLHIESSIEEIEAIKQEFSNFAGTDINSFVTCFNKYQNLAIDFVKEYPISYSLPRDFYNHNYSLKSDKKVNIVFIGFGNVNFELFKMMVMNFQFAKEKPEDSNLSKFMNAPINYYCYDNDDNRLCNDVFTKLDYEFLRDINNTNLPKMEKICNLEHKNTNVYSSEIKQQIESLLNENSYTYIIVSLKSDLENIAFSENLQGYLGDNKNFKIFTRVKEGVFYDKYNAKREITYFGHDEKLYTHDLITNKNLIMLAQGIKSAHAEKLSKEEEFKWHNLKLIHQYSKIYLALSMFFKVGLMGYKLVPSSLELKDKKVCDINNLIKNCANTEQKNYSYFFKDNVSNLMAFIEHSRWNAHYYISGYKPMGLNEFAPSLDNKIGELKCHGIIKKHSSLTSYDGLDTLFKYIYLMQKYGKDYVKHDISEITNEELNSQEFSKIEQYSYDYRLLDFINNLVNHNYLLIK